MNEQKIIFLKNVKQQLDSFGPGMCLAKWSQTTIHLGTGHTHSCHHPGTHKIPLEEIKNNPSALHNTSYKKEKRKEMMTGIRPEECQYCWNIEDSLKDNKNIFSDRIYKSSEPWSRSLVPAILDAKWEKNVDPKYLEISFNNTCNFKCSYCSPDVSSKWMEEIQEYGPYPTTRLYNSIQWIKEKHDKIPILEKEYNPYVESFWKWWPTLYYNLHTFRITGGEPLLTKHTFKVLDWIIKHPNTKLDLAINSNLVVPEKIFNKFIEKIKIILSHNLVKSVSLFTSCEAYDAQAEYIRYGLKYKDWIDNCRTFSKECPSANLSIMSTYNALSVPSYHLFLQDVLSIKMYRKSIGITGHSFFIDFPYLRNPVFLSIQILNNDFLPQIENHVNFIKNNVSNEVGFSERALNSIERILSLFKFYLENLDDDFLKIQRRDFVKFVDEHDRRRGTNFLETFPEMSDFYNFCKSV
jgi:organic radical activating enzyme